MALFDLNTTETFDVSESIREDFSDIIYNIDPTETPGLMMFGRGSASATKHEWQMDQLAVAADNAVAEGFDAVYLQVAASVRMANHTQISAKAISITGTAEVVDKAGRNSELSYQLAKRSKELKRDLEFTLFGNIPANMLSATGSTGVPRRSGAYQAYFHVNWTTTRSALPGVHISRGAGAGADGGFVEATDLFAIPVDGTQRPLIESLVKSVIQGAWTNGGDPNVLMCGPYNKSVISGFSGNSTRFDRGEDKRLVAAVDIYVSDFGEHRVVPNRFQRERDLFAITPSLWSVDYLRPFRQQAMAKTGDAENRQLLVEWCLRGGNHAGSGIVADLNTA